MGIFRLQDDEDAAVLVHEGKFGGIWARTYEDVVSNADTIQEMMTNVVKEEDFKEGYWVWVFKDGFSYLEGNEI